MPRQIRVVNGLIPGYCKIRKRGCSSSSSTTSSRLNNYRFKRAILVGSTTRSRGGGGGSRSSTPVPAWKMTASRSGAGVESPKYAGAAPISRPVSARKLAATLWEMNELPSPRVKEGLDEKKKTQLKREMRDKERMRSVQHSGSLPPHLSDPSHSPISERMDRSGTGSRQRRTSSISQRLWLADHDIGVPDSRSNASLMEIETRSQSQTPCGSMAVVRTRLKDVSNALTTSKELLKIINRMWAQENLPSSSTSLISALHAELERARLQVNQFIKEQRSDQTDINYLMKCFGEEKAAWKHKQQQTIEAAIESIAGELEVERKLRRRFESLNKKLGKELASTKASFTKAVKELESEKRTREIMEQVCDELASDIGEDRAEVEELKRESAKVHEEVEREREMLQLADKLREERVQMKLSDAKHQFQEKNAVVGKLSRQLEAFLRPKKCNKKKGCSSLNLANDEEIASHLSRSRFGSHQIDGKDDGGEVEDGLDCEEDDSAESDLHSIELNMDNNNKSFKWSNASAAVRDCRRFQIDKELKGRNSVSGKVPRKDHSLLRSISDGVEWGIEAERIQNSGEVLHKERFHEHDKPTQRKSCGDDLQRYKTVKGLREHILSSSRIGSAREFPSPTRQWSSIAEERSCVLQGSGSKSRLTEARGDAQSARRSLRR